jgi:hypothetical protein
MCLDENEPNPKRSHISLIEPSRSELKFSGPLSNSGDESRSRFKKGDICVIMLVIRFGRTFRSKPTGGDICPASAQFRGARGRLTRRLMACAACLNLAAEVGQRLTRVG